MSITRGRVYLALSWLSLIVLALDFLVDLGRPVVMATGWVLPNSPRSFINWTMLAFNVPALVASVVPGVAAWVFGRLARRAGERRGSIPAWIGAASVAICVLLWFVSALSV